MHTSPVSPSPSASQRGKKHSDYDSSKGHDLMDSNDFILPTLSNPSPPSDNWDVKKLMEDGFIIIPNAISETGLEEIREALQPHLTQTGRNNFEGTRTHRVYGLLAKSRAFDQLILHPRILSILDSILLPNHLITAFQAIQILPGETPQPLHHDDQFVTIPRPHAPFSIATIWAIDEFTSENGATLIIPGSHKWGDDRKPSKQDKRVPIEMSAGSVVVFLSTLWHGGGANTTKDRKRTAISTQHCEPWIRPQENQMLVVDPVVAAQLHPRIRAMMGYSIHFPFIGHANGEHPSKELEKRANELARLRNHAKL